MAYTRKSSYTPHSVHDGKRRFEHWYRDNQVYFITARCRDKFPAFATDKAQMIFWDRFTHYTREHGFVPIVTTLLNNHYHTLGYLQTGDQLGPMMRKLHGSVAKLVNDPLPTKRTLFWHDRRKRDYFDGCVRDEKQFRLAYRYTQTQARRAQLSEPWPGTRVGVALEPALRRAVEKRALLRGVPYARYETRAPTPPARLQPARPASAGLGTPAEPHRPAEAGRAETRAGRTERRTISGATRVGGHEPPPAPGASPLRRPCQSERPGNAVTAATLSFGSV